VIYLKSSVGIEMGQEDLLITCLRSNFAGGVFTDFMRISGYRQRAQDEVRSEIDGFFKRERVNRENVVLGVPRKDVIFRYLDLPSEVEDNLRQVVLYQVQSFEPTEDEKLCYDFVPIRDGQPGKKLRVLLVMIRKSILDAHLDLMRQLGIRPAVITAGSAALANMFLGTQGNGRDKTFILADLKTGGIELAVLRGGVIVYGREAAKQDGMSWKQLLLDEMEVAIGKARLDPEETIEGIMMAGEASELAFQEIRDEVPGCELIGDRLRFEMSSQNKAILQEAATSLGLAYSGITRRLSMKLNLLPAEYRVRQKRWAYVPTIVLSLCVAVALAGLGLQNVIQERILSRDLDLAINDLKGRVDRVNALKAQLENLEKQAASLEELLSQRDRNLEILRELTALLPSDTYVTNYTNNDCTITVQCQGPPSTSPDVIPKVAKSSLLKDVTPSGVIYKNAQTGKDVFSFTAKCEK
jgi:hypothetical protein